MPRAPLAAIGAICCQTHGIRSNATFHPLLLLLHSYKDKSTHTMCAVSFDNAECCFVSTSAIGNPLQSTEYWGIGESHQCGIQSCCYLINYVEYPGTHVLKCNVRAAGWHNVSHIDHLAASPGEPPSVPLSPRDCTFVHLRYEPIVPPRSLIHPPLTTTLFLLQLSPDAILASVWFKHPPTPHYGCWLFFPRCLIVADLVENAFPCNLIVLACEIYFFFNQKLLLVLFWITLCNWSLVEPQQWWWAAWNLK